MKKLLLGFLSFTFLISCGNKKAKMDPFATITEMVGFGRSQGRYAARKSG